MGEIAAGVILSSKLFSFSEVMATGAFKTQHNLSFRPSDSRSKTLIFRGRAMVSVLPGVRIKRTVRKIGHRCVLLL